MNNKEQTVDVGMIEDLLTSVQQSIAKEYHYLKLIKKYNSEIEFFGLDDKELNTKMEQLQGAIARLENVTKTRRNKMKLLMEYAKTNNKEVNESYWCIVKHGLIEEITLFESMQACEDEKTRFLIERELIENAKTLNEEISSWLGFPVESCSSCLSDILKGKGV